MANSIQLRSFKERLAADEVVRLFAIGRVMHPVVIEMFALAGGYGGFWADLEHSFITTEQITVAALAARANGMDCFVRMPPTGYWQVTQCLESGVGGVMGAQIRDVEHAREFLSWCRFAPQGVRGLNMGGRDAGYTHKPLAKFVEDANRDVFTAIQIETLGALEDADAIAAIDGVDLLFIGPADLSLALGVVGQFHHAKLWEAIDRVAQACKKHGKHWGCVAPDAEFAERAVAAGCRMPTIGNELHALRRGIAALQSAYADTFKQ
jgi:4-hydroxy-2-oxoheptanedioate aldolase